MKDFTIPRPRQPSWQKADNNRKDKYTANLHERMSNIHLPESINCRDPHCQNQDHSKERDSVMVDLICNMIEASHETIPMTGGKKSSEKENNDKLCDI